MVTLTSVKVGSVLCYYRSCIAYTLIYTLSLSLSHIQKTAEISMHISETQIAIYLYIFFFAFCTTIVLSMRTSCICGTLYTETTHVHARAHIHTHFESETETTQTHRQPGGIVAVVAAAAPASFFCGA